MPLTEAGVSDGVLGLEALSTVNAVSVQKLMSRATTCDFR